MLKSVTAYLLFVGLPLLGLFGVLKLGERLRAPMAVHGRYALAAEWREGATDPCLAGLLGNATSLDLTQSGHRIELRLPDTPELVLDGTLDSTTLAVAGRITRAALRHAPACVRGDSVVLRVTVERTPDATSLRGHAERRHCLACVPLGVRAMREPPPDA